MGDGSGVDGKCLWRIRGMVSTEKRFAEPIFLVIDVGFVSGIVWAEGIALAKEG